MDETHVQHPVGFVQHEDLHPVQPDQPLAHQVQQAAGAGDDDIRAAVQGFHLAALADAAEDDGAVQAFPFAVQLKVFPGLQGKLPGRGQDQGTDHFRVPLRGQRFQPLQDGQGKGGGFSGAGLGAAQDVLSFQYQRDGGLLDGGRGFIAGIADVFQKGGG